MSLPDDADCTCEVFEDKPPVFDTACPFHGAAGTMVAFMDPVKLAGAEKRRLTGGIVDPPGCESPADTRRNQFETIVALRGEIGRLRAALTYYAHPRSYGTGEHSVFIDDTGVAKSALCPEGAQTAEA